MPPTDTATPAAPASVPAPATVAASTALPNQDTATPPARVREEDAIPRAVGEVEQASSGAHTGLQAAQLARALYAAGLRPSRDQVALVLAALGGALPVACAAGGAVLTRDAWRLELLRAWGDATITPTQLQAMLAYGRDRGWGQPVARMQRVRGAVVDMDSADADTPALPPLRAAMQRTGAKQGGDAAT